MQTKTFITTMVIMVLAASIPRAEKAFKATFSPEKQEKISQIIAQSKKEGLFPDILYERIDEGIARKVPFEKLYAVAEQKTVEMRELKRFCEKSSTSSMPIAWTQRNAEQLLMTMQNGLSMKDISFYYQALSNKKNTLQDFMDIVKSVSRAQKRGMSREFLNQCVLILTEAQTDASYMRRYFSLLSTAEAQHVEAQQKVLMHALKDRMNYREIEHILQGQPNAAGFNQRDRGQDDELRQRMHEGRDRENSEQGKRGKR